jgi:NTP pyrophosphatase (non-canonical NTP hydrolase)
MEMTELTNLIKNWAFQRGLINADPNRQMLKLIEEMGELGAAMARNIRDDEKDAIGDIFVVLTILAQQLGYDIKDCIEHAYDQIKNRKGVLKDGVFVKEEK